MEINWRGVVLQAALLFVAPLAIAYGLGLPMWPVVALGAVVAAVEPPATAAPRIAALWIVGLATPLATVAAMWALL